MSETITGPDLATEISLVASLKINHILIEQSNPLSQLTMVCDRCSQPIGTIEQADTLEGLVHAARVHGGIPCLPELGSKAVDEVADVYPAAGGPGTTEAGTEDLSSGDQVNDVRYAGG